MATGLSPLPKGENFRVLIFKDGKHMVTHNHLRAVLVTPILKYGFCRKNKAIIEFEDAFCEGYRFETHTKDNIDFALQRKTEGVWNNYFLSDKRLEAILNKAKNKEKNKQEGA